MKRSLLYALWLAIGTLVCPANADAHPVDDSVSAQVKVFLDELGAERRGRAALAFDSSERHNFGWTPGARQGVRLDELNEAETHRLKDILRSVLSESGARKVDSILATEAALGVIEDAKDYRSPYKYYTSIFGEPGAPVWAMRFEGHHLSINLTFAGDELRAATPLFLGANPKTVPVGPDKGLRALQAEVDRAFNLFAALSPEQRAKARGNDEWFPGFLTRAGERRVDLGKPAGIPISALTPAQSKMLEGVIRAYLETITSAYARPYLENLIAIDRENIRFFWHGAEKYGEGSYYYRIAGRQILIEHDGRSGGSHIHAIWRDASHDFGGH